MCKKEIVVWFPFKKPTFYVTALRQVSRSCIKQSNDMSNVIIKSKYCKPALGGGVWSIFNRER